MKVFLYSIVTIILMGACSEKIEQVIVEVPAMHASEIYQRNDVKKYMLQYGSEHHDIAVSYKQKSVAVKDKDLKKAVYFLKRSITLEPTYESYLELINLLSADRDYTEASNAYNVLVSEEYYEENGKWVSGYVFGKPDENLISDYIIVNILATNTIDYYILSLAGENMDKQKIRARLIADERFEYDTASVVYKNLMVQFWTDEEVEAYKKSQQNLNALFKSVADTSSVFQINQKNVNQFRYDDFNGINYSDFEEGVNLAGMAVYYLKEKKDDPDKWLQYNINHSFHPYESLKALVYAVDTSVTACPIDMRAIYHRLVIYDANGDIISDKVLACQSGEILQTVSYNKDHFEITEYKRTWKNPYEKNNFDNEITKVEQLAKKTYSITPAGQIVEEPAVQ